MTRTGTITMSMQELDRLKVIEAVAEARLMTWRAAERLGLSRRQVERLVMRYRDEGAAGLVSRRRGTRSNHQLPQTVLDRALGLIHERYADFGPTLACEKLHECHGLVLSKETARHHDDGRGSVGAAQTAPAEGLSAASTTGLFRRTRADRRQRPSLV